MTENLWSDLQVHKNIFILKIIALLLMYESIIPFLFVSISLKLFLQKIEPYNVLFVNRVPLPIAHAQGFLGRLSSTPPYHHLRF